MLGRIAPAFLVQQGRVTGDLNSNPFYEKQVRDLPEPDIWDILSAVKRSLESDPENTHPGKLFTFLAKERRAKRGT